MKQTSKLAYLRGLKAIFAHFLVYSRKYQEIVSFSKEPITASIIKLSNCEGSH